MASTTLNQIIFIVLHGIFIFPIVILWIISFCTARRRADPARTGVTWMKILYPIQALSILFSITSAALNALIADGDGYSYYIYTSVYWDLYEAVVRLSYLGVWFGRLADILLLITVVEIGIGFLYSLDHQRSSGQKNVRYATFAIAVVMFAIATAGFGVPNAAYSAYISFKRSLTAPASSTTSSQAIYSLQQQLVITYQLATAYDALFLVISIGMVVFSSIVLRKFPKPHLLQQSVSLLVVASSLTLVHFIWNVAYDAAFLLTHRGVGGIWVNVVNPILDTWIFFIALVLFFVIAHRKHGKGLWTTQQPWMGGLPAPTSTPAGGAAGHGYAVYPQAVGFAGQPQQVYYVQQQPVAGAPGWANPPMAQGQQVVGWQLQPVSELAQPHRVHEAENREIKSELGTSAASDAQA